MPLVLYSVIRRHMKATGRYLEPSKGVECPVGAKISGDERLLGWYQNPEPWQNCFIAFTDKAIYNVEPREVVRLDLRNIVGIETPKKGTKMSGVRVRTPDGFRFLRIMGAHGVSGKVKASLERIGLGGRTQNDVINLVQVLRVLVGANL